MSPRLPHVLLVAAIAAVSCRGPEGDDEGASATESTGDASTSASAGESESGTGTDTAGTGTGVSTDVTSDATTDGTTGSTTATTTDGTTTDATTGEPDLWDEFLDAREGYLHALAVPILECVARYDTPNPAFHGCIDWHSAVHGTYALLALYRLTGESAYRDAADAVLEAGLVAQELQNLQAVAHPEEIPYGYSWFLTLAREREDATGLTDLAPLADEVAAQLRAWLAARTPTQLQSGVLADDYQSLSWAAYNLWRWAVHSGDDALAAEVDAFAHDVLLDPGFDAACPLSQEEIDADDFFPPCLHRALALTAILPAAERDAWLADFLPGSLTLTPIVAPANAHIAGLNFSRAWGLHALWRATGDVQWRDLYVDHVVTHVEQPAYWAVSYNQYSHWVAQFGVFAIALSYEP